MAFKELFDCETLSTQMNKNPEQYYFYQLKEYTVVTRILKIECEQKCLRLWSATGIMFCLNKAMTKVKTQYISLKD